MSRPAVAVIIPFAGSASELASVLNGFAELDLRQDDELVVVNNSPVPLEQIQLPTGPANVVMAPQEGSSYYARNVGAASTTAPWLLFVDADCIPSKDLLDRYFDPPPEATVAGIAGGVVPSPPSSYVERYAASRGHLDATATFHAEERPTAATANFLVRRAVFNELGGFATGIRSGGDYDFSWRLQQAGHRLSLNVDAVVEHEHRDSVRRLIRQFRKYGAGAAWLRRRGEQSGVFETCVKRALISPFRAGLLMLRGRPEDAGYALLDAVASIAQLAGGLEHNRPYWSTRARASEAHTPPEDRSYFERAAARLRR